MSRLKLFLFAFIISISFSASIFANCGLQGCPLLSSLDSTHECRWRIQPALQYVDFNLDGHSGHYTMFAQHVHYYGFPNWIVGGAASIVGLNDGHDNHTGLGNPFVFGEYRFETADMPVAVGSQLEIPFGDDTHGIAADHWMWVPYASTEKSVNQMVLGLSTGFRLSLNEEHGDAHHHLFVNPHEDKEFLYRFTAAPVQVRDRIRPHAFIDGQHILDGEGDSEGTGFLTGGIIMEIPVSKDYGWQAMLEAPLTKPRRFDWRVGIDLSLKI